MNILSMRNTGMNTAEYLPPLLFLC